MFLPIFLLYFHVADAVSMPQMLVFFFFIMEATVQRRKFDYKQRNEGNRAGITRIPVETMK